MIAMFIVEAAVTLLASLTLNYVLLMAGVIGYLSSGSRKVKNFFFGSGDAKRVHMNSSQRLPFLFDFF